MIAESQLPPPPITGIAWLDAMLTLIIAAAVGEITRRVLAWLNNGASASKARSKVEWLTALQPLIAAAINEVELWARASSNVPAAEKMARALDLVREKARGLGVPAALLSEPLLRGFIESMLATDSMAHVSPRAHTVKIDKPSGT